MLTNHTASKFLAETGFRLSRALSGAVTAALFLASSTFLYARCSSLMDYWIIRIKFALPPTGEKIGVMEFWTISDHTCARAEFHPISKRLP